MFPRLIWMLMLLAAAGPLPAQTFGGQAVDSRSGEPLVALEVRLLQHRDGLAVPAIVDSTKTDERGLFAFRVVVGGVYQAEFGPWGTPYSLGTIDTVGNDELLRRYVVPVPRAPLPQLRVETASPSEAAPPAGAPPAAAPTAAAPTVARPTAGVPTVASPPAVPVTFPTQPSLVRAAILTTFGTALGAGAGYLVAELRCGRSRGCNPTSSYPYYPGGAALGAALGSGLSEAAAKCRYGALRGVAGSVLGSLAGSLLAGDSAARAHAGASLGAPVGAVVMVATCRIAGEK